MKTNKREYIPLMNSLRRCIRYVNSSGGEITELMNNRHADCVEGSDVSKRALRTGSNLPRSLLLP